MVELEGDTEARTRYSVVVVEIDLLDFALFDYFFRNHRLLPVCSE